MLLLNACVNSNSVMFGSTRLKLEIAELRSNTANLFYTNYKEGIGIGVIREVMPNADQHLQQWSKLMRLEQEKWRGNPLVEKS